MKCLNGSSQAPSVPRRDLLRLDKLQEVWLGSDPARQIHHELEAELLNWRDAARELKSLLKARYRQRGVLRVEGPGVFSPTRREDYLAQLPGDAQRRILRRLYTQHDATLGHWRDTLRELRAAAAGFWEIEQFRQVPGIGEVGAHVLPEPAGAALRAACGRLSRSARLSALIGDPARFRTRQAFIKYARLAITDRSSDGVSEAGVWEARCLSRVSRGGWWMVESLARRSGDGC